MSNHATTPFGGQSPDEMHFGTGKHVPDELAAAKKAALQARLEENRSVPCANESPEATSRRGQETTGIERPEAPGAS